MSCNKHCWRKILPSIWQGKHHALESHDGFVQQAALALLSSTKPHTDSVYPLLSTVRTTASVSVATNAMQLLQQQPFLHHKNDIGSILQEVLKLSSPAIRAVVAKYLPVFIS